MAIHNSINLPYPIPANLGGTGVANSLSNTITLGGPISFVGAYPFIGNLTASTNITFPVSGTLLTTAGITLNGTTNQIAVSGSSPSFTLSFPSVLHTAHGNVLDDGSANATFLGTTFVFGSNTPGSPATMYVGGSSATGSDQGHLWFYKFGTTPTANGDSLGEIAVYGVNSTGTSLRAARIQAISTALATSSSVQTELAFRFTDPSGVEQIPFILTYQGMSLNGNLMTTTGAAGTVNFNFTGATNVTFPTSGVLATVGGTISSVVGTANRITVNTVSGVSTVDIAATYIGQSSINTLGTVTSGNWNASLIPMAYGGTNANLTATNNSLVYSTASALALLATANNGVLVTSNTGVPSISSTLPTATQNNITQVGTITSGIWNGTIIDSGHGGTGLGLPSPGYMLVGSGTAGNWAFLTAPSGYQIIGTDVLGGIFWLSSLPAGVQSNITITESQVTNLTTDLNSKLNLSGGTMTGNLILNADPVVALGACTKQYADAISAGLNIKQACYAASTATLTVTYSNGTSGVGATLTNAGTQAVFAIDGTTPAVNSRILIKDQSSTLQNGVYTVTNVGSVSTNWVLTRATDYDTPSEIQAGNLVVVDNGTVNSGTGWLQTSTVTTIGTSPITFSAFNLMQAGTGLTRTGNTISLTTPVSPTNGGTGVNNGLFTTTLGGNLSTANSFTTSGNFPVTQTYTGTTSVTFPTSGTLLSSANGPLNALSSYNTNGLVTQTAANTFTGRTITGTTNQISISNGDGVAGNPVISFPSVLHSANNTLDDGSGNQTINGQISISKNGPIVLSGVSTSVTNSNEVSLTLSNSNTASSGLILRWDGGNGIAIQNQSFQNWIYQGGTSNLSVKTSHNTLDDGTTGAASFAGAVTLPGNATSGLQAVPLQQIQAAVNSANFVAATFCGGF